MNSSTTSSADDLARELSYFHERGATRLELVERSANDEHMVESWTLTTVFDPRPIANAVQARADQHARRGRSYCVQAYSMTGPGDAVASVMGFVLVGTTARGVEESRIADHTALERDVVSQAVRHNEVLLRGAAANVDGIIAQYSHLLEDERRFRRAAEEKIRELETRLLEYGGANDEREQRAHERILELKKFDVLAEPVKLLAPLLISRVVAHRALPGAPEPAILGEELLSQLLESLDEEQEQRLYGLLRPAQQVIFGRLYVAYGERAIAKRANAVGTAPPTTPADARGKDAPLTDDAKKPDGDELKP